MTISISHRSILLLLMLFYSYILSAQDKPNYLDSLEVLSSESDKIALLERIINEPNAFDLPHYLELIKEGILLSKKLQDSDKELDFIYKIVDEFNYRGSYDSSLHYLNGIFPHDRPVGAEEKFGQLLSVKGRTYDALLQYDSAISYLQAAIDHFETIDDSTRMASSINLLGETYQRIALWEKAQECFYLSVDIFKSLKDTLRLCNALNNVATAFGEQKEFDRAHEERKKIFDLMKNQNDPFMIATLRVNGGVDYKQQGLYDKAISEFDYVENLVDSLNLNPQALFFTNLHRAESFEKQGKHKLADQFYGKAEEVMNDNQYLFFQPALFLRQGRNKIYLGEFQNAEKLLNSAIALSGKAGELEQLMEAESALSLLFEKTGNATQALKHHKQFTIFQDSLRNIERIKNQQSLDVRYQVREQEQKIATQQREISFISREKLLAKRFYLTLLLGLGLIGLLFFVWRSRKQMVKEAKLKQKFAQKLLASQEKERKRISSELHDSVGQSLVLIKNKVKLNNDRSTEQLVSDTLEEVRSISRALHPVVLSKLGITAAIERLIANADENSEIFFESAVDNIDGTFEESQELNLYRIIQEAISNVIKHSKSPSASITVTKSLNHVQLMIQDHGGGFDLTTDQNALTTIGMHTLKERTQILNGKLVLSSTKDEGTRIFIEIPVRG